MSCLICSTMVNKGNVNLDILIKDISVLFGLLLNLFPGDIMIDIATFLFLVCMDVLRFMMAFAVSLITTNIYTDWFFFPYLLDKFS